MNENVCNVYYIMYHTMYPIVNNNVMQYTTIQSKTCSLRA